MIEKLGLRRLISDIADLCELQAELFAVDAKQAGRKGFVAVVGLSVAVATAISTTTVLLAAFAWYLHSSFEWHPVAALLLAGLLGASLTMLLIFIAFRSASSSVATLEQTRIELTRNVSWLKSLVLDGVSEAESNSSTEAATMAQGSTSEFAPDAAESWRTKRR
jgi:Zn-dependent protease with chaperone function